MRILVYVEIHSGEVRKSGLELLSYATALKNIKGGSITVLAGPGGSPEAMDSLSQHGAEKILVIPEKNFPVADISKQGEIIRQAAEQMEAELVLFTGSSSGNYLASVVSAKLKAGMVPGIYTLPKSLEPFVIYKKVFSGKAVASVTIKTPRKVLILLPNTFEIKHSPVPVSIEDFNPLWSAPVHTGIPGIRIVDTFKTNDQIRLSEAGIVVSGGRGIKSRENWRYVDELAQLLGGATACSRPAFDEGWCPHDGYVGQTGKVISPNIYFALGISGAVQHLAGISSSKLIIAINKDPEAPIFKSADYGIVGDIKEVIPRLIKAVKNYETGTRKQKI
jgi:electron transfer flavoprotein alpha subunit